MMNSEAFGRIFEKWFFISVIKRNIFFHQLLTKATETLSNFFHTQNTFPWVQKAVTAPLPPPITTTHTSSCLPGIPDGLVPSDTAVWGAWPPGQPASSASQNDDGSPHRCQAPDHKATLALLEEVTGRAPPFDLFLFMLVPHHLVYFTSIVALEIW